MNVYVLQMEYDVPGDPEYDVVGVYTSKELAESEGEKRLPEERKVYDYIDYCVMEFELKGE